jgi:hypothetical protein
MSSNTRFLFVAALAWLAATPVSRAAETQPADPVVAVWYRGTPAGEPRRDDLTVIRALDFHGVAWPAAEASGAAAVPRLAAELGLTVVMRGERVALSPQSALKPPPIVDIVTGKTPVEQIPALAWRALAHGARAICFDAGELDGALLNRAGVAPAWLKPAQALARQISSNASLIAIARPGPAPIVDGGIAGLDVVLLDAGRAWVVIATNASDRRVEDAIVRLPKPVPYAIWVSLVDGSDLAMRNQPSGPEWRVDLEPGAARVYVIDKVMRSEILR